MMITRISYGRAALRVQGKVAGRASYRVRRGDGRPRDEARGRAVDRAGGGALRRPRGVVPGHPRGGRVVATLRIDGNSLTIADVVGVARRKTPVALDRASEQLVRAAAKLVAELADGDEPIYGVNTGFGALSKVRIPRADLAMLQVNLLRSHAAGVGEHLPEDATRAILLLRANTLASGRSGVRRETIDLLLDLLNRGVHPVVPMHGSVGASGDL